jgi:hypothetical protein
LPSSTRQETGRFGRTRLPRSGASQ